LQTGDKIRYPIELEYLLELARCLKVFDDDKISYYIKKLNTEQDFNKISVVSEIIVTSKYKMNDYEVKPEPRNKRIRKSGREGKSDLAVKFSNEWIYFEITQQQLPQIDTRDLQLLDVQGRIEEELKKGKLIPNNKKVIAHIVDSNKVLSKGWSGRFLGLLTSATIETKVPKPFEGIYYRILDSKPDEPIFLLQTPLNVVIKKQFKKTIKTEAKQVPADAKGVIIINSSWNFASFPVYVSYAKEVLNAHSFDSEILAIIVWDQYQPKTKYQIPPKNKLDQPMMNFLEIPFK